MKSRRAFRAVDLHDQRAYWSVPTGNVPSPPRRRGRRPINDNEWLKDAHYLAAAEKLGVAVHRPSGYAWAEGLAATVPADDMRIDGLKRRAYYKLSRGDGLGAAVVQLIWAWDNMTHDQRCNTLLQIEEEARRRKAWRPAAIAKCLRLGPADLLDCVAPQSLMETALPPGGRLKVGLGYLALWAFEIAFA